jgi:putative AdoMet-dependent methyltransferase
MDNPWQYDEFKQIGKDYGDEDEVENYDLSHADFRDIEAEAIVTLDLLGTSSGDVLIDFGAGTGTFAITAAQRCRQVHAVDVSASMISYAHKKAARAGVTNIEFHHAGFLTYEHNGPPVNAIATTFAFHHLPDYWKGIALNRLHKMLRAGGQFFIRDVIMPEANSLENIAAFIEQQAAAGGDFLRDDAEGHFREEFSTYDWVMDGLLTRAGFTIIHRQIDGGLLGTYICKKQTETSAG